MIDIARLRTPIQVIQTVTRPDGLDQVDEDVHVSTFFGHVMTLTSKQMEERGFDYGSGAVSILARRCELPTSRHLLVSGKRYSVVSVVEDVNEGTMIVTANLML